VLLLTFDSIVAFRMADEIVAGTPRKGVWHLLLENPYIFGLSLFASLGGFLFGYDQGVVSGVLTMESFAARFPRIYLDSSFKGWFVSTLLLCAWFGSLVNGPIADFLGRKGSMLLAVVIFAIGSAFQAGANDIPMLFAGKNMGWVILFLC
jgi:MFS family permease